MAKVRYVPVDDILLCVDCETLYSKAATAIDETYKRETWRGEVRTVCPSCGDRLIEPKVVVPPATT